MNNNKKKRLEQDGWVIGDAKDFLKLSNEDIEIIEEKINKENRMTKREKIEIIKNVLMKYEKALSDGYCYYTHSSYGYSDDDEEGDEKVNEMLEEIANEILNEIEN